MHDASGHQKTRCGHGYIRGAGRIQKGSEDEIGGDEPDQGVSLC